MLGSAAVESEDELIEVGVEVLRAHRAMVRAAKPSFQQRDGQVSEFEVVRADHLMLEAVRCERAVSSPVICPDRRASGHCLSDEASERRPSGIPDHAHADTTDALRSAIFHGDCHHGLAERSAASLARFFASDIGLVDFRRSAQQIPAGTHHRPAQFVQPGPRSLVTAQFKDALHPFGAGPVLLAHHPPDRPKPCRQRFACSLEDRPRGNRSLVLARCAAQQLPRRPSLRRAALGATETIRPPERCQVGSAGFLGREAAFELGKVPRIVFHGPQHYRLGLRQ